MTGGGSRLTETQCVKPVADAANEEGIERVSVRVIPESGALWGYTKLTKGVSCLCYPLVKA